MAKADKGSKSSKSGQAQKALRVQNEVKSAAQLLGSRGGKIGGKLRWAGVSKAERTRILRAAATKRWTKAKQRQQVKPAK